MIEEVSLRLYAWGKWARDGFSPKRGLTMRYNPPTIPQTSETVNEQAEEIDRILAKFPPKLVKYRKILKRKYFYGWTDKENALKEHVTRQTIYVWISHSHKYILKNLK